MCRRFGEGDHSRQIAVELGLEDTLDRGQHDPVDQAAHDIAGLCCGPGLIECGGEALDLLRIETRETWMQAHNRLGFGCAELGGGGLLLLLESCQPLLQCGVICAILDGCDDAGDPALDVSKLALRGGAAGFGVAGEAAEFGVELVDERGDEFRRHHPFGEAPENALLDLDAAYGKTIRAGTFGAARRTAVAVEPDNRVRTATAAADEKAAQQEAAPVCAVEGIPLLVAADLEPDLLLPDLDPFPELIIDDS